MSLKSQRPAGGAIEISTCGWSEQAARNATYAPKLKPPNHKVWPGCCARTHSATARRSSCSPTPWSNAPAELPTLRKLKRTTVMPSSRSARAAMVTTLLCMLPPSVESGWQKMAVTACAATSGSGRSTATSSGPTGPSKVNAADSVGNEGLDMPA